LNFANKFVNFFTDIEATDIPGFVYILEDSLRNIYNYNLDSGSSEYAREPVWFDNDVYDIDVCNEEEEQEEEEGIIKEEEEEIEEEENTYDDWIKAINNLSLICEEVETEDIAELADNCIKGQHGVTEVVAVSLDSFTTTSNNVVVLEEAFEKLVVTKADEDHVDICSEQHGGSKEDLQIDEQCGYGGHCCSEVIDNSQSRQWSSPNVINIEGDFCVHFNSYTSESKISASKSVRPKKEYALFCENPLGELPTALICSFQENNYLGEATDQTAKELDLDELNTDSFAGTTPCRRQLLRTPEQGSGSFVHVSDDLHNSCKTVKVRFTWNILHNVIY